MFEGNARDESDIVDPHEGACVGHEAQISRSLIRNSKIEVVCLVTGGLLVAVSRGRDNGEITKSLEENISNLGRCQILSRQTKWRSAFRLHVGWFQRLAALDSVFRASFNLRPTIIYT